MPDGSIRISTRLDNSKIDKGIVELENKIKKLQLNNANSSKEQESLQQEINKYKELCNQAEEYNQRIKDLKKQKGNFTSQYNGNIPNSQLSNYNSIQSQLDATKNKYQTITNEIDKQTPKIEKVYLKLDKVKAKQEENNNKIAEYNRKLEESKRKQLGLNYNTEGIGKSLNKGITKILKYGMALFSIRSIYGLLSNAMNSWLNGNTKGAKQLKSDIDYMKHAIGGALSPILKYIVNLLYQALGFTGALIKAFTGVDIFAGSVADYMKSTTSSANKTNKELKRQLASFDKINKLEKNDTSNGSGSGGGIVTPSQDLSVIMDKYTEQAEKLKKIFDEIKDAAIAIGIGIGTWKLAEVLGASAKLSLGLGITAAGLDFFWQGIKGFQDGEITNKDIFNTIAGVIGVGVGTAITGSALGLAFSASALLGLSMSLFFTDWAIASYGQSKTPAWVQDLLGLSNISGAERGKGANLMKKLGIPEEVAFNISVSLYFIQGIIEGLNEKFPGLKDLLFKRLKEMLIDVANQIENIPIIGKAIANGIRGAVALSGTDMTKTIVETTENAIENSAISAKKRSSESATGFMTEMKKSILAEKESLTKTIEETTVGATDKAIPAINAKAEKVSNEFTETIQDKIESSELDISNSINTTVEGATNNSKELIQRFGSTVGKFFTDDVNRIITNSEEKERLKESIEAIVDNASKNSTGNVQQDAQNLALNLTKTIDETITNENEKEKLKRALVETVKYANANAETNVIENSQKLGRQIIDNVKSGESSQQNSLSSNLSGIVRDTNNNVDTSSSNSIGANIINGIKSGINGNKSSLLGVMTNVGFSLINTIKSTLGIHSPSREMASLAKFIPLGIAEGIDSTSNKAVNSMKDLVYNLEDTMSDIDYSNVSNIPKLSRNAITYVPKQAISTNEVQRSIVGQDNNILNKLLSSIQSNSKGKMSITIPLVVDGEEWIRKTIELNENYNLVTNGGGL